MDGGARRSRKFAVPAALVGAGLLAAACGGGDEETVEAEVPPAELADCPSTLVLQTDWYPQPEFGALYNLTAGVGRIDADTGVFRGPLAADDSFTVEIRSGGPYVDFQSPMSLMVADEDVLMAMIDTDEAIEQYGVYETTAVVAPLDISPRILMWDPDTYEVESWADMDETGATISHLRGALYVDYLVGSSLVSRIQLEDSYDGSASRFIAEEGALIQEGTITRDPFNYLTYFDDWSRPVESLLVHDAGYVTYDSSLAVLDERLDDRTASCLRAFVPLVQQSIVDFQEDPTVTNELIRGIVSDLQSEWKVTEASVFDTVLRMGSEEIVSNGTDTTVGNFDIGRVEEMIEIADEQLSDIEVPADLRPEDLVSNDFVDPSIGL